MPRAASNPRTGPRTFKAFSPPVVVPALVALSVAVALHNPSSSGITLCPVKALTGFNCPGCGGTRCAHHLLHLDVAGAWQFNPLLTIALPLMAVSVLVWTFSWATKRTVRVAVPPWALWTLGAVVLAFGVLRNIPPFSAYLGPAA